jgi:hypothetical protein
MLQATVQKRELSIATRAMGFFAFEVHEIGQAMFKVTTVLI